LPFTLSFFDRALDDIFVAGADNKVGIAHELLQCVNAASTIRSS
jgi:hypothetical protein